MIDLKELKRLKRESTNGIIESAQTPQSGGERRKAGSAWFGEISPSRQAEKDCDFYEKLCNSFPLLIAMSEGFLALGGRIEPDTGRAQRPCLHPPGFTKQKQEGCCRKTGWIDIPGDEL